jgi:desampylase
VGMQIELARPALDAMLRHAAATAPDECCGLLLGQVGRIEAAVPAANLAADRARRFEIDPAALFAAHKAAREGGPELIGYYHSHPRGPAGPSAEDRAQAPGDGRVWAIVAGATVRFWRDTSRGFEALSYRLADG